jgi:YVTN family beta-propeller protein
VTRVYKSLSNDFTVGRDGKTLYLHKSIDGKPGLVSVDVASGKAIGQVTWPQAEKDFFRGGVGYTLMSEDGRYVINTASTVHMIDVSDPAHPRLAASIPVGLSPLLPDLSPDGRQLWVPNSGDGTISVIDLERRKVVQTIKTGRYMTHVAFDPDGGRVYVAEARAGGPKPAPRLLLWLYLVKMGLGGLFADKQGVYQPRPLLDTPGEIVAYDARTYRKLDLPAVQTVSVPAWLVVVPRT